MVLSPCLRDALLDCHRRQIAPGRTGTQNPENGIEKLPMVVGGHYPSFLPGPPPLVWSIGW